jgi:hypothetical protein
MNAMLQACNEEAALRLIEDLLQLPRSGAVSSATLSNACLTAARIHYGHRAFLASLGSAVRAIRIRPVVVARPIKRVANRLGLLNHGAAQA